MATPTDIVTAERAVDLITEHAIPDVVQARCVSMLSQHSVIDIAASVQPENVNTVLPALGIDVFYVINGVRAVVNTAFLYRAMP